MTALLIILAAIALLIIGYITYGSWLAKQWGIDPSRKTPAIEKEDGVDYVAAPPAVLMGHHFSSIAGAGPINGPIQASIFGWVPVFLWCIVGGIFFGGLQDYGSLFASIRHDGKSLGEIINDTMGQKAKKLFLIFGLLVLILVIASFVNVVAGTFFTEEGGFGFTGNPTNNQTTAMISLLFILIAIVYGYVTNKMNIKTVPASICGVIGIIVITAIGLNCGFVMSRTAWIVFIGIYIAVASLVPVWILLQPRDYLSSFLLYAMIGIVSQYRHSTASNLRTDHSCSRHCSSQLLAVLVPDSIHLYLQVLHQSNLRTKKMQSLSDMVQCLLNLHSASFL